MLSFIPGSAIDQSPFAEDIWRFRHRHFVERFGWHQLRRDDGREIDQFDDAQAIHLVLDDCGVIGYSRLLPTTAPHLLSHVYPELLPGLDYPKGPTIYEWTRCVAEPDAVTMGLPGSHLLMTGVMEFCLVAGIDALIVETHPKLVNLLVSTGWDVTPLAAPSSLGECLVVPIHAKASIAGLLQHHDLYGINGSVLNISPEAVNPISGHSFEPVLEHPHFPVEEGKRYAT